MVELGALESSGPGTPCNEAWPQAHLGGGVGTVSWTPAWGTGEHRDGFAVSDPQTLSDKRTALPSSWATSPPGLPVGSLADTGGGTVRQNAHRAHLSAGGRRVRHGGDSGKQVLCQSPRDSGHGRPAPGRRPLTTPASGPGPVGRFLSTDERGSPNRDAVVTDGGRWREPERPPGRGGLSGPADAGGSAPAAEGTMRLSLRLTVLPLRAGADGLVAMGTPAAAPSREPGAPSRQRAAVRPRL